MKGDRRDLLAGLAALAGSGVLSPARAGASARRWNVRDHGARGDGRTLDHPAINRAIMACRAAGGGVVVLPAGSYRSGTVILLSDVTLHLEAGAVLLGSRDLADYTPVDTRRAGELAALSSIFDARDAGPIHLISAVGAQNVAITGSGTIDGQGSAFWEPRPDPKTPAQRYVHRALPRPSPMVDFVGCRNVLVDGVTLVNAPGWTLRLADCVRAVVRRVRVDNPVFGPNTDGVDIVASEDVEVSQCVFTTGDDAICLKSASVDGRAVRPTRRVRVRDCLITTRCNGLKIGTASFGRIEDVVMTNCTIVDDPTNPFSRAISGVAIEMVDGGTLERVRVSGIRVHGAHTPLFIRRAARNRRADGSIGVLRDVTIEDVRATAGTIASSITGLAGAPVQDVRLRGLSFASGKVEPGPERSAVPEMPTDYPEARMFGPLPASGLYIRHALGLDARDLELVAPRDERRPFIVADDVRSLAMTGVRLIGAMEAEQALVLDRVAQTHLAAVSSSHARTIALTGTPAGEVKLLGDGMTLVGTPWPNRNTRAGGRPSPR